MVMWMMWVEVCHFFFVISLLSVLNKMAQAPKRMTNTSSQRFPLNSVGEVEGLAPSLSSQAAPRRTFQLQSPDWCSLWSSGMQQGTIIRGFLLQWGWHHWHKWATNPIKSNMSWAHQSSNAGWEIYSLPCQTSCWDWCIDFKSISLNALWRKWHSFLHLKSS